jgi:hypothetical protein
MGSVTHQRRRLPRRVYWFRRSFVLVVGLLLVFGVGKLLGGTGQDDPGSTITANPSSARQAGASATIGPVAPSGKLRAKAKVPLLAPTGECRDDEVSVVPSVYRAWAGRPVVIHLQLRGTQPACTFSVSPESLVAKIVSGQDRIWSSQDCPKAIPTTSVVVRSGEPVDVPVIWSGRRSDDKCTGQLAWALPGFYHVFAAALGSTPTDVQFEITQAAPMLVTQTASPRPSASASAGVRQPSSTTTSQRPAASPRANGSKKP